MPSPLSPPPSPARAAPAPAVASGASGSDQLQQQASPAITLLPGTPEPLGPSLAHTGGAVNFALFSKNATGVSLVLKVSSWFGEERGAKGNYTWFTY